MIDPCPSDIQINNGPDIATWFIVIIILSILIFEGWAVFNHKPTVSKKFQKWSNQWHLFRWLVVCAGLAILAWHWMF